MSTLASVEDAKVWIESKKLWHIVGPAIFSRLASYSMLIITQAFAGHLGDLELAAISIANNVIVGFDLGLLVLLDFSLAIFHFSKTERRRRQALYLHCL
jgi:Na+-driven multidrug efflux pump